MTITLFIMLITLFSTITGLCTQFVKKILDEFHIKYSSNIIACIVACIVGIGGTAIYYALNAIPFVGLNIVCMLLMGVASAIGSMVGYDKVIQTIHQFKEK